MNLPDPARCLLPFNRVQTKDTSDSTGAAFHVMQFRLAGTDTYWHPFHRAAKRRSLNKSADKVGVQITPLPTLRTTETQHLRGVRRTYARR